MEAGRRLRVQRRRPRARPLPRGRGPAGRRARARRRARRLARRTRHGARRGAPSARFDARARGLAVAGTELGPVEISGAIGRGQAHGRWRVPGHADSPRSVSWTTAGSEASRPTSRRRTSPSWERRSACRTSPGTGGRGRASRWRPRGIRCSRWTRPYPTCGSDPCSRPAHRERGRRPSRRSPSDVSAFGSALTAVGTIGEGGEYAFDVAADSLALSWAGPDTLLPAVAVGDHGPGERSAGRRAARSRLTASSAASRPRSAMSISRSPVRRGSLPPRSRSTSRVSCSPAISARSRSAA